jgi:hypothetical protein
MADWYYAKNGERQGPVSSAQLRQLAQAGELLPTDMVFKEGGTQWVAASTIANLFSGTSGVSTRSSGSSAPARGRDRDEGSLDFDDRDDDRPIRRQSKSGGGGVGDVLMFRKMIAPIVIMIIFWLAVGGLILGGLIMTALALFRNVTAGLVTGVIALIGVPIYILLIRLYCEVMIIVFRIHERLVDIRDILKKQSSDKS